MTRRNRVLCRFQGCMSSSKRRCRWSARLPGEGGERAIRPGAPPFATVEGEKGGGRANRSEAPPSAAVKVGNELSAHRPLSTIARDRRDHGSEKLGLRKGLAQNLAGEILERKCATERLTDLHIPTDHRIWNVKSWTPGILQERKAETSNAGANVHCEINKIHATRMSFTT